MPFAEHILLEVSGKLPRRKIAPRSESGFGLGLALELGLGGGGNFPRTTFRECLSMATC